MSTLSLATRDDDAAALEEPSSRRALDRIWASPWVGWISALGAAAIFGLVSGVLTPRGPITSAEALLSMVAAVVVGVAAGFVTGRRWSLLFAPLVFAVVFEITRLGVDGPTVDGIHLDSFYGWIAFGTGRLFHGVLVLVPMAIGGRYGVALSRRLGRPRTVRLSGLGWSILGLGTLAVLLVGVLLARPASTAPILGSDGQPLAGSIAEFTQVSLGGHEQTVLIRGRSVDNPVLLYLSGGPGGSDLGAMRQDVTLEQDFVVVTWEQRGVGKSYSALDPAGTLTVDEMVADTIELTNYLRGRFDQNRVYLTGTSWGTTLGVLAAQQHPELYAAMVGTGQMVSQRETDVMFWEDTLAWAETTGNESLTQTLRANGPPPYDDILKYEAGISHEHDFTPYPGLDLSKEMPAILFVPENTLMDRVNGFRSFLDTFSVLYPQLQDVDFRVDVPQLEIPFYMVIGQYEARGRAVLANEWFDMLDAPVKERFVFAHSGHRPIFQEPAEFAGVMRRVLSETGAG
ncbi:MAG: alpha/beta hydrolase [Acidimicrobiia bacterium]